MAPGLKDRRARTIGLMRLLLAPAAAALLLALAAPAGAAPRPVTGKQAVAERVQGTVTVTPPGSSRAQRLTHARVLQMGSEIDATRGTVKIVTTKDAHGHIQFGTFSQGAFTLTQTRGSHPLTNLTLAGGDFNVCPPSAGGRTIGATAARARPVRRLFGQAHGRFRTRGRNSSATVRGTKWVTEDTCDGTRTEDRQGKVVAKSDNLTYNLKPGQSVQILCDPNGQPPVSSLFCLAVLSEPAKNIFAFGIATESPDVSAFDLCITNPDLTQQCETHQFPPPDSSGFRTSGVACVPGGGPGDYAVRWRLNGTDLAVPIPFTSTLPRNPAPFCVEG
jgi:hypothetical protein